MADLARDADALLRRLGLAARKKLGQNFMVSERDLECIAEAVSPSKGELVIEVGPGLGFLTKRLVDRDARVVLIEKDRGFSEYLRGEFPAATVFNEDILDFDIQERLHPSAPVQVIGNIPYNITSAILEWTIAQRANVRRAFYTMQWEVAQRLSASPGGKNWGSLSVFVSFWFDVSLLKKIPSDSFRPAPKVDSALVRLEPLPSPRAAVKDETLFFEIVRKAFQKRRKTLLNALENDASNAFSKPNLRQAFERIRVAPDRRPETLSIAEWARLSDALAVGL